MVPWVLGVDCYTGCSCTASLKLRQLAGWERLDHKRKKSAVFPGGTKQYCSRVCRPLPPLLRYRGLRWPRSWLRHPRKYLLHLTTHPNNRSRRVVVSFTYICDCGSTCACVGVYCVHSVMPLSRSPRPGLLGCPPTCYFLSFSYQRQVSTGSLKVTRCVSLKQTWTAEKTPVTLALVADATVGRVCLLVDLAHLYLV